MTRQAASLIVLSLVFLKPVSVHAQVPPLIRYQGTLVDTQNVPLEGAHTLTFRLYPAATGGSAVWTEAQPGVPISRGVFNVLLGQVAPLTVAFEKEYWLSVQVDADGEMSPRQQLTSVPYAYRAAVAEGLAEKPAGFSVDSAKTLTNGLVAYWKLDEASGTRSDATGVNLLTDHNTVTQAAGKVGQAVQFIRANLEYLSIADNASLSTGDVDFTILAWVYIDSKPGEMYIVHKGHTGIVNATEYGLRIDGDRFQFFVENGSAGGVVSANGLGSPSIGTWHHVIAWHDATANTINIVVNNGATDSAFYVGGGQDTAYGFTVGASANFAGNSWNGRIDEVGFWKRVLTVQERADLYNAGAGNAYQLGGFILESPTTGKRHRLVTEELP